ncbi:FAD-dependent oxidoreductase, partial [Actinoalloteichus spitiensis]|uniref:FAD-dependent oxidoreductase n=1 Tax=Actinoalloteichus spitiensis TaxID=252394 RepID=UPI0005845884
MGRRAVVVGGGIAGLACATALGQRGWDVSVWEREHDHRPEGTALGMWPAAQRALERLGVVDELRRVGVRQESFVLRTSTGRVLGGVDAERLERRTGLPTVLVARPTLLATLNAAVPEGVVRFGAEVDDPSALLADCDLLVGADGIRGVVRPAFFGDRTEIRYAGAVAWRGVAPLEVEGHGEIWGRRALFGVTGISPGRTNWYATIRGPEDAPAPPDDLAHVRRFFGDWPDPVPQLLAAMDGETVLRNRLYELRPPLRSFVAGRVALVGDAAHAMTPNLGQGACQALVDAVTLADSVGEGSDVPGGLRAYDRARRRPAQRVAAGAHLLSRVAQADRLAAPRNALARLLLPRP